MPGCGGYLIIWAAGVGVKHPGSQTSPGYRHVDRCQSGEIQPLRNTRAISLLFHWIGPYFSLKFTLSTISLAKKIHRWQQQMIFCLHDNFWPFVAKATLKQQSRGWFRDTGLLRLLLKWGSGSSLLHSASLQGLSNNILCFGFFFFNILYLWSMGQW